MTSLTRSVLGLVALQRVAEMVWSLRNERRLRRRGGIELGRGHYPAMVAMHGAWLASSAVEASRAPRVRFGPLVAVAALQPIRYWIIGSLGDRWTTRIIVVPGEPEVKSGPFAYVRHPNYMVVAAEIALVPLAFGARRTATGFAVLNALLMAVRIPAEQAALRSARPHDDDER